MLIPFPFWSVDYKLPSGEALVWSICWSVVVNSDADDRFSWNAEWWYGSSSFLYNTETDGNEIHAYSSWKDKAKNV
jgi:hypothetical protein